MSTTVPQRSTMQCAQPHIPEELARKMPQGFKCPAICNEEEAAVLQDPSNQPPEEEEAPFWCQMYYYQFDHKSESFRGYFDEITIDGLCAPSEGNRFCLGIKGSIVANPMVEKARRQIGEGCRVTRRDQDVYFQCLSESPIFIQCPLYAAGAGDDLATVYRLAKPQIIQIYNEERFTELLDKCRKKPYTQLLRLQSMGHIRISFVKGWGSSYRRQTITATPCWVEIFLTRALERLDSVLMETSEWSQNLIENNN